MGEDGSTPALCGRDPTWPPPGLSQAQQLKHNAREGTTEKGNDLLCQLFNSIHIRMDISAIGS